MAARLPALYFFAIAIWSAYVDHFSAAAILNGREVNMNWMRWVCLLASLVFVAVEPTFAQAQKPNVVFILADNVGYGDMGPYGAGSCADARRRASTSLPA